MPTTSVTTAIAKDVMNSSVRGIVESGSLREAIALLAHHDESGIPVINSSGALVGIITQYDVLPAFADPGMLDQPVRNVMSRNSVTVNVDTALAEVAAKFYEMRIHRAPVVSNGSVVGVISRTDLVKHLAETAA